MVTLTVWRKLQPLALPCCLVACAAPSATAPPSATTNELAQSERIGRLEAERAAAAALAQKERAARIDAEVKAAVLAYNVAIGDYNLLVTQALCDHLRGVQIDAASAARMEAAGTRVSSFVVGCGKDEPGNVCVERKAREAAR